MRQYNRIADAILTLLKSITAMLNKHGEGTVFFGVSDSGEVCGLDIGKDTLMDIRNRIRDKIEPRIYAEIKDYADEKGKKYVKVSAKGADAPYDEDFPRVLEQAFRIGSRAE